MTTCELAIDRGECRNSSRPGSRLALFRIFELMSIWNERARQRRELMEIPEYLLRDMGITAEDVYREIRKPFWQA